MLHSDSSKVVSYQLSNMVVEVTCKAEHEVQAVREFANTGNFPCPAPLHSSPVYRCHAKTHPGGEVLW